MAIKEVQMVIPPTILAKYVNLRCLSSANEMMQSVHSEKAVAFELI